MRATRSGFTLFELILVAALFVIIASVGFPLFYSFLVDSRVPAAADQIRAQLVEARNLAIEQGKPVQFEFAEGSGRFRLMIEGNEEPAVSDTLPDEVTFGASQAPDAAGGDYKVAAVFLPLGTAREDSEIIVGIPDVRRITIHVRALTGAVTMSGTPTGGQP